MGRDGVGSGDGGCGLEKTAVGREGAMGTDNGRRKGRGGVAAGEGGKESKRMAVKGKKMKKEGEHRGISTKEAHANDQYH